MTSQGILLWALAFLAFSGCSAGVSRSDGDPVTADTVDDAGMITGTTAGTQGSVTSVPTPGRADCPLGQQPNNFTGGPSICCSGAYQICDDFEDSAPGSDPNATRWEIEKMSSTYGLLPSDNPNKADPDPAVIISISDTMSARGKQSLLIRAQNSNKLAHGGWHHDMLVNRSIFPAPNNTFWGRAFIYYVSDANSQLAGGHCTFADASGPVAGNDNSTFYTWWRLSTFGNLAINCEHGDGGAGAAPRLPVNQWACLEWQYKGPVGAPNGTLANTNEVHLYLDGNQLAATDAGSETADNTAGVAPIYDAFRIGFETYGYQYNPTPAYFEMYYDEVALDFNRIGCAN